MKGIKVLKRFRDLGASIRIFPPEAGERTDS